MELSRIRLLLGLGAIRMAMGIVAICNIEPGMEICYDYQWPALDWTPRRHCGAPNCRGWVVAASEVKRMKKIAKKAKRKGKHKHGH